MNILYKYCTVDAYELFIYFEARKNEYYENLKFALKWNRCDIAKTSILTGEEKFNAIELDDLMKQAFIDNKPDFIELLLENGVIIENFLTNSRLFSLYNTNKVKFDFFFIKYFP